MSYNLRNRLQGVQYLSIRNRLLIASLILSVLASYGPNWIIGHIQVLTERQGKSVHRREQLASASLILKSINHCHSEMIAYAVSGNSSWLSQIKISLDSAQRALKALHFNLHADKQILLFDEPESRENVEIISREFAAWQDRLVIPLIKSSVPLKMQPYSSSFIKSILEDSNFNELNFHLLRLTENLERSHRASDEASIRATKRIRYVVLGSALTFMIALSLFMLSLWFSLIPRLNSLLIAAQEIKSGNLSYRLPTMEVSGGTEISTLGKAFNEMASSLQEKNEKLLELNKVKTDFVSTVSHELRTPLTAIKGSLGLILGGVIAPIPVEVKQMLEITAKNTDRLIRLINDVLDVAKIEAGAMRLNLDKFNIDFIIRDAIEAIQPYANAHKIEIQYHTANPSPLLVVDPDRLEQVLVNLLSNAIKFSQDESKVNVLLKLHADNVAIHIIDEGIGIPHQEATQLFQKFRRVQNRPYQDRGGTGLGLAICKALVEEHGGQISVSSEPGKGSEFIFTLPWNGIDIQSQSELAA